MKSITDTPKSEIPQDTDYIHVIDLSHVLTVDKLHPVQTSGALYRPVLPLLQKKPQLVSLNYLPLTGCDHLLFVF